MKRCGIYLITHVETGRMYVGQSKDIDKRWREHSKGRTGSGVMGHAIAKHGWSAFTTSVLEICHSHAMNEAEKKWIESLSTLHPRGYNLTTGGQQYEFTDSARALISERTRAIMTPEWIAARAITQRGIPKSPEWKAKMSARQSQPDSVARLRAMVNNQSAETREKIAASKRGRKLSPETCAKISAAKTGVSTGPHAKFSEETRARMSASAKARCARQKAERIGGQK